MIQSSTMLAVSAFDDAQSMTSVDLKDMDDVEKDRTKEEDQWIKEADEKENSISSSNAIAKTFGWGGIGAICFTFLAGAIFKIPVLESMIKDTKFDDYSLVSILAIGFTGSAYVKHAYYPEIDEKFRQRISMQRYNRICDKIVVIKDRMCEDDINKENKKQLQKTLTYFECRKFTYETSVATNITVTRDQIRDIQI